MRLEAREILSACAGLEPRLVRGGEEMVVSGVSTDSRNVASGQLFLALKGDRFNGHDFALQALEGGAGGVLVRSGWANGHQAPAGGLIVEVSDTLRALGLLARHWRLKHRARVLAISGSMGKSSVKEMAAAILATRLKVVKNEGNLNNLIGLPLTLFKIDAATEAAVVELGVNQVGEMEQLVEIAQPQAGLLNNVGPVHLEGFGDLAGVLKAKTALWQGLPPEATAVVNLDDPLLAEAAKELRRPVIKFGRAEGADVRLTASEIKGRDGLELEIAVWGEKFRAHLSAVGEFQALNAAAACAGTLALGAGKSEMIEGLANYRPLAHRMRLSKGLGGINIMDDAYNANPAAMVAALRTLKGLAPAGARKGAVLGQMAELGSGSAEAHRSLGREAAGAGLDLLVALGPFAEDVIRGAKEAGLEAASLAADQTEAGRLIREALAEGDWVLVKGSRVAGLEKTVALLSGETDGA